MPSIETGFRDGDHDVFERLYVENLEWGKATLYRAGLSREQAEDTYNQVWLEVFKNRRSFSFKCSIRTYLFQIFRHKVAETYRNKISTQEISPDHGASEFREDSSHASLPANGDATRDIALALAAQFSEDEILLLQGLIQVPKEQHYIVLTELFGISEGALRTRKCRLRAKYDRITRDVQEYLARENCHDK